MRAAFWPPRRYSRPRPDLFSRRRTVYPGIGVVRAGTIPPRFNCHAGAPRRGCRDDGGEFHRAVKSVFPANERGKVLGINTATVYVGLSVGPSLGGLLVQHLGWRSVFYVNVPIGIIVVFLALFKLKREKGEVKADTLDPVGIVTYGLALFMIVLGLTLSEGRVATLPIALLLGGLTALGVFVFYERRAPSPLLDLSLFNNTAFACTVLTSLLNYSSVFGVGFIMSLYLQLVPGFSASQAGLIMLTQPIMMALFSPLGGRLSDRSSRASFRPSA